jgi:hypothetical protein
VYSYLVKGELSDIVKIIDVTAPGYKWVNAESMKYVLRRGLFDEVALCRELSVNQLDICSSGVEQPAFRMMVGYSQDEKLEGFIPLMDGRSVQPYGPPRSMFVINDGFRTEEEFMPQDTYVMHEFIAIMSKVSRQISSRKFVIHESSWDSLPSDLPKDICEMAYNMWLVCKHLKENRTVPLGALNLLSGLESKADVWKCAPDLIDAFAEAIPDMRVGQRAPEVEKPKTSLLRMQDFESSSLEIKTEVTPILEEVAESKVAANKQPSSLKDFMEEFKVPESLLPELVRFISNHSETAMCTQ